MHDFFVEAIVLSLDHHPLARTLIQVHQDGDVFVPVHSIPEVPITDSGQSMGVLYRWEANSPIAQRCQNILGVFMAFGSVVDLTKGFTITLTWPEGKLLTCYGITERDV